MKTTAYLLGLAAVIALLALNLTESIRIRKALCGEYPIYRQSYTLEDGLTTGAFDRNFANEEALERQGYRYVGSRQERGRIEMDFARVDRTGKVLTYDEATELRDARLAKSGAK